MCRSFNRSRAFIFLHVKLPSAASSIFAGLQIGIVLALIGAVVGEFIASEQGSAISSARHGEYERHTMFAGVLILAAIGMAGSSLMRIIAKRIVFWEGGRTAAPSEEV